MDGFQGITFVLMAGTAAVAVGAVVVAAVKAGQAAERKLREDWDAAARAIGIGRPVPGFWSSGSRLEGTVGGLPVLVKGHQGKGANTVYEVHVPFSSLRLSSEGITSAIGKLVSGDDVRTGDAVFDEKALVRGDPHDMAALFDADTREAALAVLRLGGSAMNGKITLHQSGFERSGEKIIHKTRTLLALAERLAAAHQRSVPERLAEIAAEDPLTPVKRNALDSLLLRAVQDRAPRAVVDAALSRALEDADAEIRLTAATSGRVGLSRSREVIVLLVRDPRSADAIRAKGLAALGKLDGVDRPDDLLDALLESGGNESRVAAIETLGLRRCKTSRVMRFARAAHAPTRAAVARALERIGDHSAQPLLLSMVEDAEEPVRLAAIQALGAIADVSAVETLLHLRGGVFGGDLKRVAQEAIAKIQSRVSGAGAGQLSVTDAPAEAGALSAVAAEEGALSEPSGPSPARKVTT